jgi:biopolymer transport protein TolR
MAATAQPRARGGHKRRRRRQMAEINVTPMVDVMLVLLVVFMITAPLLTTGVANSTALPGQDEPLSVTVAADGLIYIQDSAIELEQLGPRLTAIAERRPDVRVFVRGDRKVDYGRIMAVVGAINQAGITKVALVTDPTPPIRQTVAAGSAAPP